MPVQRFRQTIGILTTFLGTLVCAACALDGTGLVYADTFVAGDATVVRVRGFGALARVRADDPGLSLGYAENIYVFETAGTSGLPTAGRYYFHVPLPSRNSIALVAFTVGLDMTASASAFGLNVGLSQRALLARAAAGEAAFRTPRHQS